MLQIKGNYIYKDGSPFYWQGDTAWLMFYNLGREEIARYLKNRSLLGYNVIQVVLNYSSDKSRDINEMPHERADVYSEEYFAKVTFAIEYAASLGMYFAVLPLWGSLVKNALMTECEIMEYVDMVSRRLGKYDNVIWVVGGDVRGDVNFALFDKIGKKLKENTPEKLVTFHPFGRTGSYLWFNDAPWLDFNMFQSGHRRYDQLTLSSWDDNNLQNEDAFGEDNYKYVLKNFSYKIKKPCLDAEPSYEGIVQGLHDPMEPYWEARHVRRYMYWSVLAGACGFTYGNNAIIQFSKDGRGAYGCRETWEYALHSPGGAEVQYLFALMKRLNFTKGRPMNETVLNNKILSHYICAFGGDNYYMVYTYKGDLVRIDFSAYSKKRMAAYFVNPENGSMSYINTFCGQNTLELRPVRRRELSNDWLILFEEE